MTIALENQKRELRRLVDEDTATFARLLQELLVKDFEATFDFVKTQKLFLKPRSSIWIMRLELELQPWLLRAPLSGKRKAILKRHLVICKTIQHLFEVIDKESSSLRIWQVPTDVLLMRLFSEIESLRLQSGDVLSREGENDNIMHGMRRSELIRRKLRGACDNLTIIIDQIPRYGVKYVGDSDLTDEDIENALRLANSADVILHILDCYTYKQFPISICDKRLKMYPVKSQLEIASEWATLRTLSSATLDNYKISKEIDSAEELAKELLQQPILFEVFFGSEGGARVFDALGQVKQQLHHVFRKELQDLITPDFLLNTLNGEFQVDQLIEFWALLFQIACCAHIWQNILKVGPPIISRASLLATITSSLHCSSEYANRLVTQFSLDPSKGKQDPFFRPLIQLNQSDYLIPYTFIETGRFTRNLFTIAIKEGNVDFSGKGLRPLEALRVLFQNAGYEVQLNVPISAPEGPITDIDIVATKDNAVFIGQTKVLIHPDTPYEEWKVLQNLKKAARQLRMSLDYFPLLRNRFDLAGDGASIMPFLLTNVWDFTGCTIDGFKIVDFSYLSNLLTGGEIGTLRFDSDPPQWTPKKLIRGRYPTSKELASLISNPIHEKMFYKPDFKEHRFQIEDWNISVPVESFD